MHLIAWGGPFETFREHGMWRFSCSIVASPGPVAIMSLVVCFPVWTCLCFMVAGNPGEIMLYVFATIYALPYFAARVYL